MLMLSFAQGLSDIYQTHSLSISESIRDTVATNFSTSTLGYIKGFFKHKIYLKLFVGFKFEAETSL